MNGYNSNAEGEYTLEQVLEMRNKALDDVRDSAGNIRLTMQRLFEPPKATNPLGMFAGNIDRVIAVYDGVLLGMKVIRKIRKLVTRR